jgi:hypothetical protein
MISHQDKCLFVHIPKAAGQSVESIFVSRMGLTWEQREALLLRPNSDPSKGPPRLAHLTASEYLGLGYVSETQFSKYIKFSFVRNPWARMVSEFTYRQGLNEKAYQGQFKDFLFTSFPQPSADNYALAKDGYRHILPQWQFLYDGEGKKLVDFIGKFENLQTDFNQICQLLNIPQQNLPHINKTSALSLTKRLRHKFLQIIPALGHKPHYSDYYDSESQEFIRQRYQRDIELFDYKFERK